MMAAMQLNIVQLADAQMLRLSPTLPTIEISLAPAEDPAPELYSPFSPLEAPLTPGADDMDDYRPSLLSPPPPAMRLSPLRPLSTTRQTGKGIDSEAFQNMLRASKEKSTSRVAKKSQVSLRKEVALKAHKSKQLERRALFLSKVGQPPSPSAVSMPKTPPESPAVFHYTLPSPGLVSPLALFDTLGLDDPNAPNKVSLKPWVEQVDYRLAKDSELPVTPMVVVTSAEGAMHTPESRGHKRGRSIPSLDQITERFSTSQVAPSPALATKSAHVSSRLPAFLAQRAHETPARLPLRHVQPPPQRTPPPVSKALPPVPTVPVRVDSLPEKKQALQVTTTIVPSLSAKPSPVKLTAKNLDALNSRERTARDMLSAIGRRTGIRGPALRARTLSQLASSLLAKTDVSVDDEERKLRRNSAPAELPAKCRIGFAHPVLAMPSGF